MQALNFPNHKVSKYTKIRNDLSSNWKSVPLPKKYKVTELDQKQICSSSNELTILKRRPSLFKVPGGERDQVHVDKWTQISNTIDTLFFPSATPLFPFSVFAFGKYVRVHLFMYILVFSSSSTFSYIRTR